MNHLSLVYLFKIGGTLLLWCVPLLFFPTALLESAGLPVKPTDMFLRMLGWGYLALCVGYAFGLRAALANRRLMGPIWVGIVSNGGATIYLLNYGLAGTWSDWSPILQVAGWGSALATALIAAGLVAFGVFGSDPAVE